MRHSLPAKQKAPCCRLILIKLRCNLFMMEVGLLPKRGEGYRTLKGNWDVPDKGRCVEGRFLLQTDLISAVRVKVQTPLLCVEVSGVLCWHFSLHINSVLSELSAPHPPSCSPHPSTVVSPHPSSSTIDRWQFVLFQHVFLRQIHTRKPTEIFAACAFASQKLSWRLFRLRCGKTYFLYRNSKIPFQI